MRKQSRNTAVGYTNKNKQRVIKQTDLAGTDHGQRVYILMCIKCKYEYGANGSNIYERKCPKCQGGKPGIKFE